MPAWFYPVLAICLVALTAALVTALLALTRTARRAASVLALVEKELQGEIPRIVVNVRELTGDLRQVSAGVSDEVDRIRQLTGRVQEIGDATARVAVALSGFTRVGQVVGIAAAVKTGLDVFFHRLRKRGDNGHEQ